MVHLSLDTTLIFFMNTIIIIIIFFFIFFFSSASGDSLNRNWFALFFRFFLGWHFIPFHARHDNPCAWLTSMPSMTSVSLSLSFFTMPGMNIPCEPQSPSLSENEACDLSVRQYSWAWSSFFHVSGAFISIDELVRYVFMPTQYQTLNNHKLEQLYSL